MEQRLKLHITGGDSRLRAEQSRLSFEMGHHAEVYSDLAELIDASPRDGVIIACQNVLVGGVDDLIIVNTPDALLVCKKEDEQHIKQYVAKVKEQKGDTYL